MASAALRAQDSSPNAFTPAPQVFEEKRREGDKCWKAWTLDYDGRVKEKRGEDPPEDPEIVKARKEKETAEKEQAAAEAFKAW